MTLCSIQELYSYHYYKILSFATFFKEAKAFTIVFKIMIGISFYQNELSKASSFHELKGG